MIKAELLDIEDQVTKENKIYIKFTGEEYKDGDRFIQVSQSEFDALVKTFVDKIVATAKLKNAKNEGKDIGSA